MPRGWSGARQPDVQAGGTAHVADARILSLPVHCWPRGRSFRMGGRLPVHQAAIR